MTDDRIATEADVVTKLSPRLVHDTTAKLTTLISAKGMMLFAVIDQADEGRQVRLTLRETALVIFGSPEADTPVMAASPLSALPPHRGPGREPDWHQRPHRRARGYLAPGFSPP